MLRIQIIGLALMSALMLSAVAAGSASAETELHQWLLVHHIEGGGLVHLLLAEPIKVHSLGLLLLSDHNPAGFGEAQVHCKGFNDGTVGPHGLDLLLAITTELLKGSDRIPCLIDKAGGCQTGGKPEALALALHLPWLTHLALINGQLRDKILSDGNGGPGWLVLCTSILGTESDDVCLAENGETNVGVENVAEGVLTKFEGINSGNAECSLNGGAFRKETGLVNGPALIESPSSKLLLRVSFGP